MGDGVRCDGSGAQVAAKGGIRSGLVACGRGTVGSANMGNSLTRETQNLAVAAWKLLRRWRKLRAASNGNHNRG